MKECSVGRLRILYVLDFFKKNSDEMHPVNSHDIIKYLKSKNISATRKTIYEDIEALTKFGFDIYKSPITKEGYYLISRKFDFPQIKTICDAVATAPFITSKKTDELIEIISSLSSKYNRDKLIKLTSYKNRIKCNNEQIYYNIDAICTAIYENKKISFDYFTYIIENNKSLLEKKYRITVSPYSVAWNDDKYYLISNDDFLQSLKNYRLDKIKNVEILDENTVHFSRVSEYSEYFDTGNYLKKNIMMYAGKDCKIEILCLNSMLNTMIDKFGEDCEIINKYKGRFLIRTNVYLSDGLVNWLLPYSDKIYVEKPVILREEIHKKLKQISKSLECNSLKI